MDIAGHGRMEAARQLEFETVPTIKLTHLSDAQKRVYRIADKKIVLRGTWDMTLLAEEVRIILDSS